METYHYLVIIRKSDFIDLFKYGHFNVCHIQEFDGDLEKHANDTALFERVTSNMNMFEYSFEYLMIHFKKDIYLSSDAEIDIKDVQNTYAFDEDAKREMSISFDPRIQIHVSPWSHYFEELKQNLFVKQSLLGINNLWTVFGLTQDDLEKCKELITEDCIKESFRELFDNERPSGNLPVWVYLLRYERHSFYPKDMRGFFCDFIHVFCNYLNKKELQGDVAETTSIYDSIISMPSDSQFKGILEVVKKSPLSEKTESEANCKFSIVAPLFLYLKDSYQDGMVKLPDESYINYVKSFGIEGTLSIYLLGITLGYDKTYDAFYESADLKFFKKKAVSRDIQNEKPLLSEEKDCKNYSESQSQNVVSVDKHEVNEDNAISIGKTTVISNGVQPTLFDEELVTTSVVPIACLRNKKGDIRLPESNEEYEKFKKAGYVEVKQFNDKVKESIKQLGYDPEIIKQKFSKKK